VIIFEKGYDEALDYHVDWSAWLAGADPEADDTIATSTWTVDPGLTAGFDSYSQTTTFLWLSGGVAGSTYNVRNVVTTANGRTGERVFKVQAVLRKYTQP
jgi:hypothetical protein